MSMSRDRKHEIIKKTIEGAGLAWGEEGDELTTEVDGIKFYARRELAYGSQITWLVRMKGGRTEQRCLSRGALNFEVAGLLMRRRSA